MLAIGEVIKLPQSLNSNRHDGKNEVPTAGIDQAHGQGDPNQSNENAFSKIRHDAKLRTFATYDGV